MQFQYINFSFAASARKQNAVGLTIIRGDFRFNGENCLPTQLDRSFAVQRKETRPIELSARHGITLQLKCRIGISWSERRTFSRDILRLRMEAGLVNNK